MSNCTLRTTISRLSICFAFLALPTEPLKAQERYSCEISDATEAVICKQDGDAAKVFEYSLPGLSTLLPSNKLQSNEPAIGLTGLEAFREAAEKFRGSKLEAFRNSLEDFRLRVESERRFDRALYDALINAYGQLMDRYRNGMAIYRAEIQEYRDGVYRIVVP